MEQITEEFKDFFKKNENLTSEELKKFLQTKIETTESKQVRQDLTKRLDAIEKMKGSDQLQGEELKTELNNLSEKFDDNLNILDESISKGNELLSDGFSKVSGVLRDSFGPVFEL